MTTVVTVTTVTMIADVGRLRDETRDGSQLRSAEATQDVAQREKSHRIYRILRGSHVSGDQVA